jgi:Bacterial PH domain
MSPPPDASGVRPGARVGPAGRYQSWGTFSGVTIGVYVVVLLLLYFVVAHAPIVSNPDYIYALMVVTLFFLARYLSTHYQIDDAYFYARRILGSRRIPLSDIHKIEAGRLRDLSPTSFFGSWGYRGRMWSPVIGKFDAVFTDPSGLVITPDEVPIFISPRQPEEFARELSRRVRSYPGALSVDAGAP